VLKGNSAYIPYYGKFVIGRVCESNQSLRQYTRKYIYNWA